MKLIRDDVLSVIQAFLDKKECFTSLDVYCMLGIRFNDDAYPIYEQVADAYRQGLMGQYLAEIVHLPLESGGSANPWRYYLPKSNKKFEISINGGLTLGPEILGHFLLLGANVEIISFNDKIVLTPTTKPISSPGDIVDMVAHTSRPIYIPYALCAQAGKDSGIVTVTVYSDKIEII